jgi:hypothetical protein
MQTLVGCKISVAFVALVVDFEYFIIFLKCRKEIKKKIRFMKKKIGK